MLPFDPKARKALPLYTFLTQYFPDAIAELVKVSVNGNAQHNPGEPLHWSRGKSTDQLDAAMRHLFDHGAGIRYDESGMMVLAQAAWRILAEIQIIKDRERQPSAQDGAGQAIECTPARSYGLDPCKHEIQDKEPTRGCIPGPVRSGRLDTIDSHRHSGNMDGVFDAQSERETTAGHVCSQGGEIDPRDPQVRGGGVHRG
jgi:hypothetical protein